ncbi:hypothetical protein [Flavobacterium sp. HJ-32-4]|uniref:hypothetical protein n=1 Tax=Flavobacterium sp. HJ-32-4 TaxID=1160795 RepID=UPI001F1478D4|nr:hypothetical protein [Flavobacterium sp. HJ-32-4]UMY65308.1 hypothetical protein MKO97_12460 [Flavobacterium sp. HJ-32-4]
MIVPSYTNNMAYGVFIKNKTNSSGSIGKNATPEAAHHWAPSLTDTNIVVYTTTNAYGFYQNNGSSGYWEAQSFERNPYRRGGFQ